MLLHTIIAESCWRQACLYPLQLAGRRDVHRIVLRAPDRILDNGLTADSIRIEMQPRSGEDRVPRDTGMAL